MMFLELVDTKLKEGCLIPVLPIFAKQDNCAFQWIRNIAHIDYVRSSLRYESQMRNPETLHAYVKLEADKLH